MSRFGCCLRECAVVSIRSDMTGPSFWVCLFVCLGGGRFFFVFLLVGSPELLKVLHRKLELVPSFNL